MDGAQLLSQEVQRSKEEVNRDMKRIESGKALGPNGIPAEVRESAI